MPAFLVIVLIAVVSAFGQADTTEMAASVPEWGNIEIESRLSVDSLPQNDTLTFIVRLRIKGNPDDYAIADPGNPPIANLDLCGTSQANKTEGAGSEITLIKEYRYSYTPTNIGMAYINPLRIQYIYVPNGSSRNLATGRMEIMVTDAIIPDEPVGILPFVIGGVVLIAIFVAVLIVRSKNKRGLLAENEVSLSSEENTRQLLHEVKKEAGDNPEKAIDAFSRILIGYITEKYKIDARSLSDEQLISALEMKGVPGGVISNLKESLELSDKVRFAGLSAHPGDADMVELGLESLITYGERQNRETEIEQSE